MAQKLRTSWAYPFTNIGSDTSKDFSGTDTYLTKGAALIDGYISNALSNQYITLTAKSNSATNHILRLKYDTNARTLFDGTRGTYLVNGEPVGNQDYLQSIDITQLSNGFYLNNWFKHNTGVTTVGYYNHHWYAYDGTDRYQVGTHYNGTTHVIQISKNSVSVATANLPSALSGSTWYNLSIDLSNTGQLDVTVNGTTCSYNTGVTFSNWALMAIWKLRINFYDVADVAINDGSGVSDNSTAPSIRGINFLNSATLTTNSGFSQVGGTGILDNLRDGSDSTRISASADLSYLDFSLSDISTVTGSLYSASNFSKIASIDIVGRQIEATASGSLLKAKIIDDTAVVNREEDLSLPLTVGNGVVTMDNDGSSDWVLANLDAGAFDFELTFDKP